MQTSRKKNAPCRSAGGGALRQSESAAGRRRKRRIVGNGGESFGGPLKNDRANDICRPCSVFGPMVREPHKRSFKPPCADISSRPDSRNALPVVENF